MCAVDSPEVCCLKEFLTSVETSGITLPGKEIKGKCCSATMLNDGSDLHEESTLKRCYSNAPEGE